MSQNTLSRFASAFSLSMIMHACAVSPNYNPSPVQDSGVSNDSPNSVQDSGLSADVSNNFRIYGSCEEAFGRGSNPAADRARDIIASCPSIRRSLLWQRPSGDTVSFDVWTADQYELVDRYFSQYRLGIPIDTSTVDCRLPMPFPENEAFKRFALRVAHHLALEEHHGDPVSGVAWSLLHYNERQLAALFDSREQYALDAENQYSAPWTESTIYFCDPELSRRFLVGVNSTARADGSFPINRDESLPSNMLNSTMEETLGAISVWLGVYGLHDLNTYSGDIDTVLAPQFSPLSGRYQIMHGGCASESAIIRQLALSLNIPLVSVRNATKNPEIAFEQYQNEFGRRPVLSEMTHSGLVLYMNDGSYRMVWHSDDIGAKAAFPSSLVDANGARITSISNRLNYIFNSFWKTPEQLTSLGFHPIENLPVIDLFAPRTPPRFGRFGGYWEGAENTRTFSEATPDEAIHELWMMARLGSSRGGYLSNYCAYEFPQISFPPFLRRNFRFEASLAARIFSPEWFTVRASQIVGGMGGCDNLAQPPSPTAIHGYRRDPQ